jgi:hypothetical protein
MWVGDGIGFDSPAPEVGLSCLGTNLLVEARDKRFQCDLDATAQLIKRTRHNEQSHGGVTAGIGAVGLEPNVKANACWHSFHAFSIRGAAYPPTKARSTTNTISVFTLTLPGC